MSPSGLVAEVVPGVWQLALPKRDRFLRTVNVYLLAGGNGFTQVDAGEDTPECQEAYGRALAEVGIGASAIERVVLTHAHHDHFGLLTSPEGPSAATVCAHPADIAFLGDRFVNSDSYLAALRSWLAEHGASEQEVDRLVSASGADVSSLLGLGIEPIEDGAELAVGDYRLTARWTPGHTPGHLCLREAEGQFALVGDHLLQNVATHVGLQPGWPENPLPRYLASLEELADARTGAELALPGHGPFYAGARSRAAALLAHQRQRRETIRASISEEPASAVEVARAVWANSQPYSWEEFKPHLQRNGVLQVAAHLDLLVQEGLAVRSPSPPYRFAAAMGATPAPTGRYPTGAPGEKQADAPDVL